MLDYRTAGESHGTSALALIEGLPAGMTFDSDAVNAALRRRQGGFGRGGRMKIETDRVNVLSGVLSGVTIGSPLVLEIKNNDARLDSTPPIHRPRPGHADFAGAMKWLTTDCRSTLERASARETAARVAAGATAALLLARFGMTAVGFVTRIGPIGASVAPHLRGADIAAARDASDVYCPDAAASQQMIDAIQRAKSDKDTLGGIVEVRIYGAPPGIGSCMRWQDKLDARIMAALGSVQAIKGVEIGAGFACAESPGSRVHDEMEFDAGRRGEPLLGFTRRSNNAGGIEGGMTNGMTIIVRAAMKPISTLLRGMDSVNLETLQPERSDYERSDICAVPAASVVAEHVVAFEIARAFLEKFGGDTIGEVEAAYQHYLTKARSLAPKSP